MSTHFPSSVSEIKKCPSSNQTSTASSDTLRAQESNGSSKRKAVSRKSLRTTFWERGSAEAITTEILKAAISDLAPGIKEINLREVAGAIHFSNFDNASQDELTFLASVAAHGSKRAIDLAAKLHWRCQRPLRALRAMMSVPSRNCSGKSAKRKPLSGSRASSRKRSSTA